MHTYKKFYKYRHSFTTIHQFQQLGMRRDFPPRCPTLSSLHLSNPSPSPSRFPYLSSWHTRQPGNLLGHLSSGTPLGTCSPVSFFKRVFLCCTYSRLWLWLCSLLLSVYLPPIYLFCLIRIRVVQTPTLYYYLLSCSFRTVKYSLVKCALLSTTPYFYWFACINMHLQAIPKIYNLTNRDKHKRFKV